MKEQIERVFPQTVLNGCLETISDQEFGIYDSETKRCYRQTDSDGIIHFTVENPAAKSIHFLAIDKCLFDDNDPIERCDFAVFDAKTFVFVEIKETSKAGQRASHNQKAKSQLKATISHFTNVLSFTSKRLEAYACVGRTEARPTQKASDLNDEFEFARLGATLYHGNRKRFT
ncbi:hypothetical protein [Larkinella punicea]|uniref:Uncharacterized protein n=1 Tax=Larkinella punicea TaxID=2315727 RepID=A0A368JDB0_9BACT|nr:hypothetical protein [Larkinella punicea]RCR65658.1 hypothetical protein DUE52_30790 [Larkinella punicea]